MPTCFIRHHIGPTRHEAFGAGDRGPVIARCGAELIGFSASHEGSSAGACDIGGPVAGEAYRARLADDPPGREGYAFARRERFLLREERTFLKRADAPQGDTL